MSDVVERLKEAKLAEIVGCGSAAVDLSLIEEAISEIERLRAVAGKAIEGVSFSDIRPTNYTPANVELRGGFKTK